jgi:holin-like protein
MIAALGRLLLFQLIGEGLSFGLKLPIPGPVLGMALLLGWLLWRPREAEQIRPTAQEILKHLSLLFVPAGVGVMLHGARLADEGVKLLMALVLSTVLTIAVTALVALWAVRRFGREDGPVDA